MVDPYHILGISKKFTLEELRDKYKALAVKVHPDKGGTQELFLLVTKCYKALLKEYEKRKSQKEYHELKTEFNKNMQKHTPTASSSMSGQKFDIDKFNKVFSENKLDNPYDKGYGNWMSDAPPPDEVQVKKKNIDNDKFNALFEKSTRLDKNNKYIIKYTEPEPMIASKKIGFTELGADHIEDFSGENTTNKNLNYMDYKVAHTTSKIVDPKLLKEVKSYRNMEELERHRSTLKYDMEEDIAEVVAARERAERHKEQQRRQAQQKHDDMISSHYERVNKLFLGRIPSH